MMDDSHAFRFCPRCGSALERRLLKSTEPERLVCTGAPCGFVFYLDPKIAVGTIIDVGSGRLVLCRRAIEPGYGKWVFPGGYVATALAGSLMHDDEQLEAKEFTRESIPWGQLAFRSTEEGLRDYFSRP